MLWVLPLEVWQQVLGFCPFDEYARLTAGGITSREFYYLLKQSLLDLRFGTKLPAPAVGGLWMASRDVLATHVRVLCLGICSCFFCFWCAILFSVCLSGQRSFLLAFRFLSWLCL